MCQNFGQPLWQDKVFFPPTLVLKQYLRSYASIHAASSDLTWTSWLRAHPAAPTLIPPFPADIFPLHLCAVSQCFSPAALIKLALFIYLFTAFRDASLGSTLTGIH